MKRITYLKTLLVGLCAMVATSAWAEEWSAVWTADFSSAPSGMTYSVANGSVDISSGVLFYHQGGGSGNRAINTSFTADAFNVDSNWQMEFDWGASSANTNASNVAFATNKGVCFTISWASYATTVTITDANSGELTTTLPIDGYNKATMTNLSHFIITGDTDNGIYLTVTNGETTYVNNVLVSSTFGYPASFNGSLGRAVSHMALDNVVFKTPHVAGFVPAPSATITGIVGTDRKFTLSCTDTDATLYYSETELDANASGWTEYTSEVTTSSAIVYAIAKKGSNVSSVFSFETGAGTTVSLSAPTFAVTNFVSEGGKYICTFDASSNQSNVQFSPTATLSATFTDLNDNTEEVTLPYTPTAEGTLTVTASSNGYASSSSSTKVYGSYIQTWQSLDYSSLVGIDAVQETLGTDWTLLDGHGRWASWQDKEYNFYQYGVGGSTVSITIDNNIKMRNVVVLAEGMGLGRNVTGGEAISIINTAVGDIVKFEIYNGYGNDINKGTNTYISYAISDGVNRPSMYSTNGALLVQAALYCPATTTATIGENGFATFASPYNVKLPSGVTAYTAKVSGERVNFTKVENGEIPANTGVLLEGTAGEITLDVVATATALGTNDFKVNTSGATFAAAENTTYFAMVKDSDPLKFGTVNPSTVAIPANKAYLAVVGNSEARLTVTFDGETTAIKSIDNAETSNAIYNLNGQRVEKTQKGLYIVNGKKTIVK